MAAVGRFGPPLVVMGVIFALSSRSDLDTGLGPWDTALRKLGHMAEYGLLWFLWWRALRYRRPVAAIAITLAYAASDEFHQTFVEGRAGTPVDVAIDALGVGLAGLAVWLRASRGRSP